MIEMNLHTPQSVEAATELREIAAVGKQLISPKLSKPLVSVVQDTLVGVNRLTRPTEFFTRREFMNLLVHSKRWDGRVPPPAKTDPVPLWSGQQVVSCLLPSVYISMGNKMWDKKNGKSDPNYVLIQNGQIQNGVLDGDVFDKALIHILYNDFSPELTVDFLDSLQAVVATYLQNAGFSVGMSDIIADADTLTKIGEESEQLKKRLESLQLQVHMGLFDNPTGRTNQEEFENRVFQTLNKAIEAAGKMGLKSLAATNRMVNMVKCGSKGSDLNIAQMIALLGQQSIEGKRIAYGFQDRTLPHFKRYDDGAAARGFIESSFVKGLSPHEFFFHAMTGREGLIDTAVKTADSGYMQRQLVKTMEDLMTWHDGSIRDAGNTIVQYTYGDDGISATKIENQSINLASLTDTEIRNRFAVEDVAADRSQRHIATVMEDRDILVRNVFAGRVGGAVQSAVHLPRLIANAVEQLKLDAAAPGFAPVGGAHVLDTIDRILAQTKPGNRLWAALLRHHLNPRDLKALGFTRAAFDWLAEQVVIKHMRSWVVPGEMSGIIAAQSLGETTTQLTLNSVDWDTEIIIARDGKLWTPQIGEFIDDYIASCERAQPERVQRLANNQLYVSLEGDGHEWQAISCDAEGKIHWTRLEAITRHPVVNADGTDTILEVEMETGRSVKATKGKSFLCYRGGRLEETDGADLRVGDQLSLLDNLQIESLPSVTSVSLREYLPPSEWLYGTDVAQALTAMKHADATGERLWFSGTNGGPWTVPYSRSDAFRDAFANGKNSHAAAIASGFVYPKKLWTKISQIPDMIPLDRAFGFFCGAFVAEGSTSPTQIQITNNDDAYLAPIRALLDTWQVGHHTTAGDKVIAKTGISGHTQSLIIHSTLLTALVKKLFGRISYEKTLPDWVLQAPDDFVKGFLDGYISGDGCIALDGSLLFSSVSQSLVRRVAALLTRLGVSGTFGKHMPKLGASVRLHYTYRASKYYSARLSKYLTLTIKSKQERLEAAAAKPSKPKEEHFNETRIVTVKAIKEVKPIKGWVYDLTVEKTRNFVTLECLNCVDTFHLSGYSGKSAMTRGVPRLKELFKVTQNPKVTSLTVFLRPDLRASKDEARRLAQELEFTMLKDLVTTTRIYYDPPTSAGGSLVAADQDWLNFFAEFEGAAGAGAEVPTPWVIRMELNREKMFSKNITMEDINYVLKAANPDITLTYTDHNASQMVLRIRLPVADSKAANALNDLAHVKTMQNKLLMGTLIRGLPGLKSVSFRKLTGDEEQYERNPAADGKYDVVPQFVLDTIGTNFLDVMIHPDVDGTKLISNHIHDIYDNLGIEAARMVLFREIFGLFEQQAPVNYRHVSILVDAMTNRGRLMSADRIGVNRKARIGPLAKASFEQTEHIMRKAAMFGEMDPVTGVAANIMTGQPIHGGTSFTQVLLDESALRQFMTTAPALDARRKRIERAPRMAQEEVEALLESREAPGCRQVDLRIPSALPAATTAQSADELPELEITLVDE